MTQPVLTAAVRGNLNSLQTTSALMGRTQERLATGLKVNSALDNANSYFAAKDLNGRASDLGGLLDGLGQDVSTVKASVEALESMETLLQTVKAKVNQASSASTAAERTALTTEANDLMAEIREIAEDAGYGGTNLLAGDSLTSKFNEAGDNELVTSGVQFTDSSALADVAGLADAAEVTAALGVVDASISAVRSAASSLTTNLTVIETRSNFTSNMIDTLEEGAGKLTLADTNEESANMLALQTRQQLGVTALSLSAQAEQSVLRLF